MEWGKVEEALIEAAASPDENAHAAQQRKRYAFPGAVLLVGQGGEIVYEHAVGCRSLVPEVTPMQRDTVFDVASLTKVIVTTTLAMQLVDRGLLEVNRRLSRIFQTFSTHGKEGMTIRHLLAHCAGYPGTLPFYKQIARLDAGERAGIMCTRGAIEMVYGEIFKTRLENMPGKVAKYSDVGFILLGHALEVLNGGRFLDKLAVEHIFAPLKLRSTGFIDLFRVKRRGIAPVTDQIAPTLQCPWRGRVLVGEVHDENAWAMGGVAPHTGVFTTARDVHTFASEMIECYYGRGKLISKDVVRAFWAVDGTVPTSTWALGWDTPNEQGSSSGKYFSSSAVGHLGFTGCSLWIDPEREVDVVLLTNRIHPSLENNGIREFRPLIHDLVMEALGYS